MQVFVSLIKPVYIPCFTVFGHQKSLSKFFISLQRLFIHLLFLFSFSEIQPQTSHYDQRHQNQYAAEHCVGDDLTWPCG